jgi:hypothetical protein
MQPGTTLGQDGGGVEPQSASARRSMLDTSVGLSASADSTTRSRGACAAGSPLIATGPSRAIVATPIPAVSIADEKRSNMLITA